MSTGTASNSSSRPYRKRRRAELERATRERITAAAVELHGTVGPARTTISELAERAGVQRATVYRHFPDEGSLFEACSAHWAADNPLPDLAPALQIAEPEHRLRAVLAALYGYYETAEPMLSNIFRDVPSMPALAAISRRRAGGLTALAGQLAADWDGCDPELLTAAIALALDFRVWQMLVRERGLSRAQAIDLMVGSTAGSRPRS
jgi:AcrR family transcriptional regulator